MTKRKIFTVALCVALAGGCDLFLGPSKTGQGQLYTANDPRYDPFFVDVHKSQVAAASWPDEQKAAKKPIAEALDLPATASYATIVSATKERKENRKGADIGSAIDATVQAHLDLAKKMNVEAERLSALAKKGDELTSSASDDRANMGADKADDDKVKKKVEIKHELSAAQSAAATLARQAKNTAREAEAFAVDVKRAYDGKDPDRSTKSEEPKPEPPPAKPAETKAPEPPPKPPEPPPKTAAKPAPPPKKAEAAPKPKSEAPPPRPPKPSPAPSQKPNDEVFNP